MAIIGENNFRYFKKINRLFAGADYDYNLDQFLGIFNGQDGITYDVNFGNITANSLIASVIGDSSSTIYGDGSQLTGISADVVNLSPTAFPPLSIFNALEKNGIEASNPNSLNIRNSFNTSTPMTASIRVPYLTTAGTVIYFDHGLTGELEEINNTQTTADWTAGTNTPTIAADSTNYLKGDKSIKMSKTVAGAIDIYDTVVLSLTDRNLRISAFPNTLTNLSYLYVLLYTSAGNTVEYRFPVATLTASAWNHLTVNLDSAPDATAGTFVESSITRVYLGALTSSSQAIEVSWSTLTAISREPFLVPGYSQAVIVRDGTNQQHISVMSEDSNLKGKYVLSDALSNNYSSNTTMITSNSGTVSGNQMTHASTATGANALQAKVVNSLQLHGVLPRASLSSFARYYHPPLEITAFTSGTQIEAYSATNVSAYYTAGTTVIVYKRLRVNGEYQSMNGTATKNFFYATLANNSSYAGTTLSLVLADAIDPGTDETGYYIVPESILFEYCAGSKTATTFTQAVPSELIVKSNEIPYTSVPYIHSHWKMNELSGNAINSRQPSGTFNLTQGGTVPSTAGKLNLARGPFSATNYFSWAAGGSNATIFDTNLFVVEAWVKISTVSNNPIIIGKHTLNTAGWWLRLTTSGYPEILISGIVTLTSTTNIADNKWHYLVGCQLVASGNNTFLYSDGSLIATGASGAMIKSTSDLVIGTDNAKTTNYFQGLIDSPAYWSTVPTKTELEAIIAQRYAQGRGREYGNDAGYTLKYNIPNLTNIEKLETITTIDRKNSAQEPVLYETGSQLY